VKYVFLGSAILLCCCFLAKADICQVPSISYGQTVVVGTPVETNYYYSVGSDQSQELTRDLFKLVGASESDSADVNRRVLGLFENSCVRCHKPGASNPGGIQLFTSDRKLFVDSDAKKELRRRERVYEAVDGGDMPKNAQPLTASEKALLLKWVNLAK